MKVSLVYAATFAGLTLTVMALASTVRESPMLTEIKKRYRILLKHLRDTPHIDPRFDVFRYNEPIISGIDSSRMNKGTIGYNVNKGYEIFICLDEKGSVDAAMHVLIHELAHMTVPEYDHTDAYWASFKDLRSLCSTLGLINTVSNTPTLYCGGEITV
jgi:hypothetical protein